MATRSYEKDGSVIEYGSTGIGSRADGQTIVPSDAVKAAQLFEAARSMGRAQGQIEAMQRASAEARAIDQFNQKRRLLADQIVMLTNSLREQLKENAMAGLGAVKYAQSWQKRRVK